MFEIHLMRVSDYTFSVFQFRTGQGVKIVTFLNNCVFLIVTGHVLRDIIEVTGHVLRDILVHSDEVIGQGNTRDTLKHILSL